MNTPDQAGRPSAPPHSGSISSPRMHSLPAKAECDEAGYRENLKFDLPSSLVVFLVALPLCLGIAIASGAPPLAGLISGAVGGILVGSLSGSHLAVSGPAAGLASIVMVAISSLGFEAFLLAAALGGALQVVLGFARAGIFAYYIPSSVIKGMLAAIGLILVLKQLPHALGNDLNFDGDLTLWPQGAVGPFDAFAYASRHVELGAVTIAALGLLILIAWPRIPGLTKVKWLPAPLAVVSMGIGVNALFGSIAPDWQLKADHLVSIPGPSDLLPQLVFPDFGQIMSGTIWSTAFTIAAVASIETLLCIEAIDKLDPYKRTTPTNRELVAQGTGNLVSSLIGGLPLTAVIVRGSANVHSGARTRLSSVLHGVWLVTAVLLGAPIMNQIPLAALAAILLHVGYKLANFTLFKHMAKQRIDTMAPFMVTVVAILLLDLLKGVGLGVGVGLFFILRENLASPFFIHQREGHDAAGQEHTVIELSENVSFLNKASFNRVLQMLPRGANVEIDGSHSSYVHADVTEIIHEFAQVASTRGIRVKLTSIPAAPSQSGDH